jgi:ribosomal protein S18 acetylase RimI-like enzyme
MAVARSNESVRPIDARDLERVVTIDRTHTGYSRRRFFERRFACAALRPDDFVQIGMVRSGLLRGFAIARLLRGEFGREEAVAVLDAIGVEAQSQDQGVGQFLIEQLVQIMQQKGIRSLHSQARWADVQLLRFFDAAGFRLSPRVVLERSVADPLIEPVEDRRTASGTSMKIPTRVGDAAEINYGGPAAPDFGPLARDKSPVRTMQESDLPAMIAIDRRITGRDRSEYFKGMFEKALQESDVRVSLVAECNGQPAGFIMARVDRGEFGRFEPTAVMDTIGVDPDYQEQGIGRALLSQLLLNLGTLRIERLHTEIGWSDRDLLAFLDRCGFCPSQELCLERAIA